MIKCEDIGDQKSSVKILEIKNRLPRFRIRACSAPVGFEKEQSGLMA